MSSGYMVFNNVAINLAASLIVSYGLAEVRFENPTPFLMTITVALAALLNGTVIPADVPGWRMPLLS